MKDKIGCFEAVVVPVADEVADGAVVFDVVWPKVDVGKLNGEAVVDADGAIVLPAVLREFGNVTDAAGFVVDKLLNEFAVEDWGNDVVVAFGVLFKSLVLLLKEKAPKPLVDVEVALLVRLVLEAGATVAVKTGAASDDCVTLVFKKPKLGFAVVAVVLVVEEEELPNNDLFESPACCVLAVVLKLNVEPVPPRLKPDELGVVLDESVAVGWLTAVEVWPKRFVDVAGAVAPVFDPNENDGVTLFRPVWVAPAPSPDAVLPNKLEVLVVVGSALLVVVLVEGDEVLKLKRELDWDGWVAGADVVVVVAADDPNKFVELVFKLPPKPNEVPLEPNKFVEGVLPPAVVVAAGPPKLKAGCVDGAVVLLGAAPNEKGVVLVGAVEAGVDVNANENGLFWPNILFYL